MNQSLWFLGIGRLFSYNELLWVQLTHQQINFEENDDEFCHFDFGKSNTVGLHISVKHFNVGICSTFENVKWLQPWMSSTVNSTINYGP